MAKLLGLAIGMFTLIDGVLGLFAPDRWRELWHCIGSCMPGKSTEYMDEVVDVTEKYRVSSPSTTTTIFVAELAFGLFMLKLAKKAKW